MKNSVLVLILFVMQNLWSQSTTIYMIRHAEKGDASADPELSEAGQARAAKWTVCFNDIPLDAIYSSDYKRTKQTAMPIAVSKGKEITIYNPSTLHLKMLTTENPGKTILIVGHSNTIPKQINDLLQQNKYPDIDESEFGHLYKITVDGNAIETALMIP